MATYVDKILFASSGHDATKTYYYRIIEKATGKIWDAVAEEFSLTTTWANSVHAMTEIGVSGQYPIDFSDAVEAVGWVEVVVYSQAGVSPANTDHVTERYAKQIGSIFGF